MSTPNWLKSLVQEMTDPTSTMHVMTEQAVLAQFSTLRERCTFLAFYRATLRPIESSNSGRLQVVVSLSSPVDAATLHGHFASACWRSLEEVLVRGRRGHPNRLLNMLDGVLTSNPIKTIGEVPDDSKTDAFVYGKELVIFAPPNAIDVAVAPDMTLETKGEAVRLTFGIDLRLLSQSKVYCVPWSQRSGFVGALS